MKIATPPEYLGAPFIGKEIPWNSLKGEICRVKCLTFFANVEGHKVRSLGRANPYALLKVESPALEQEAVLPIRYRPDFISLWEIFKQRGVNEKEEVIISYTEFFKKGLKKLLNPIKPKLHFFVYPIGHLEEAYDSSFKPQDVAAWFKPIAKWHPKGWQG